MGVGRCPAAPFSRRLSSARSARPGRPTPGRGARGRLHLRPGDRTSGRRYDREGRCPRRERRIAGPSHLGRRGIHQADRGDEHRADAHCGRPNEPSEAVRGIPPGIAAQRRHGNVVTPRGPIRRGFHQSRSRGLPQARGEHVADLFLRQHASRSARAKAGDRAILSSNGIDAESRQQIGNALYKDLSRQAVRNASIAFNGQNIEATETISRFAVDVFPDVRKSPPWLRLACKRALGPRNWLTLRSAVHGLAGR